MKKEKDTRSKYWETMCDILEKEFPKKKCKERGNAIVMLSYIEIMLHLGVKEFRKKFNDIFDLCE
jgi:hypothetical protein